MLTFLDRFPVQKMSQRIRTNGSPTSSCSGVTAGSPSGSPGISAVGVSLLGRLLPMKATVPFQLKAQAQHPLQTRTVLSTGNGTYSRSPTRSLSTITAPVSSPPASQCTPGATSASPALPSPSRSSPANPRTSHAQYSGVHVSPQCCSDSSLLASCSSASPPPSSSSSSSSTTTFSSLWSCGHRAKQLQLPEHDRLSPDRLSPSSPVCTDKLRLPVANSWCTTNCNGNIRRTSSLDALTAPYLSGHWPRDPSQAPCAPCMKDKSTQTPSAWADEYEEEKKRGCHKRSASCGSTDQLKEIVKLRQQLQRSKHSSRHHRDKDRKSPFNGNHAAINQSQAPVPKNVLISIPISKSSVSRFRNSVEGLNQEIERINIRDPGDREEFILHEAPDGHRAPLPLSSRSIDTQTPLGTTATSNHSNSSSRSHSISPTFLNVPSEPCSNSSSPHEDETLADGREKDLTPGSPLPKYASSPKPNNSYMFKREPPEGCERVKVFTEETQARPRRELPQFIPPDKNKVNFIPQIGSAFCPVSNHRPQMTTQELHNLKNQSLTPEASRRSCLLSPSPSSCLSEN